MAKTVVCPSAQLREQHTTVRGDESAYKAVMKRTYFRGMKAGYVLEERWEALENGETSSCRNDAYRSEMLEPRAEIITGCLKVVGKTAV
jgi:hypothetical protein